MHCTYYCTNLEPSVITMSHVSLTELRKNLANYFDQVSANREVLANIRRIEAARITFDSAPSSAVADAPKASEAVAGLPDDATRN